MYELQCPQCNKSQPHQLEDAVLSCQTCSTSFSFDAKTGRKEIFADHFIIPNALDLGKVKESALEWLRRIHHKPNSVDYEYMVSGIESFSLPFWVVSIESHTVWKGLVKRQRPDMSLRQNRGGDYLVEKGVFRRSYRWAISGRQNICEIWGMHRLHHPMEQIDVEWDGFPIDSTFSRGKLEEPSPGKNSDESLYDRKESFDLKLANGLPIYGIQIDSKEALRRARFQVEQYHYKLAKKNVNYLTDIRSELEIVGVQLIHLPFWHVTYMYRPRNMLRYFYQPQKKNLLLDGREAGILEHELALTFKDKIQVNSIILGFAAAATTLLGIMLHPVFFMVSIFSLIIIMVSHYLNGMRTQKEFKPDPEIKHGGLGSRFAVENEGET
jgi:hypothetical protein